MGNKCSAFPFWYADVFATENDAGLRCKLDTHHTLAGFLFRACVVVAPGLMAHFRFHLLHQQNLNAVEDMVCT